MEFQELLTHVRIILSMEALRWYFVGAFIVRMFTVMLFNHLTWKKLLSLSFILLITGPISIIGITLLDEILPDTRFEGYPETILAMTLVAFLLGQLVAKFILVSNELQNRQYAQSRALRVQRLKSSAKRLLEVSHPDNVRG